ncbi:hypothetical protein [Arcticibacter sp. MXS-1]|uniref:hypothetical protein n=1 Tax=Arcticibacter sp. MXS-1 TaxID=3341726 RepID=UPI0035A8F839
MSTLIFSIWVLTVLAFFMNGTSVAQESGDAEKVRTQMSAFVKNLLSEQVDTIVTYQQNAVGYEPVILEPVGASKEVTDSLFCEVERSAFVIWALKGKVYVKKIHPCWSFKPLIVEQRKIHEYMRCLSRAGEIKAFEIKTAAGRQKILSSDHSIVAEVGFYKKGIMKSWIINSEDLLKSSNDGARNVNYRSNQANPAVQFSAFLGHMFAVVVFERGYDTGKTMPRKY